jgi:hypothetical protein
MSNGNKYTNIKFKFNATGSGNSNWTASVIAFTTSLRKATRRYHEAIKDCFLDFRIIYIPHAYNEKAGNRPGLIYNYITVTFQTSERNISETTLKELTSDLKKLCESLLTFTFRTVNATIENFENTEDIDIYDKIVTVVELLRNTATSSHRVKLAPAPHGQLAIQKLANLLLRFQHPVGYSLTLDLHCWSDEEIELLYQGDIDLGIESIGTAGNGGLVEERDDSPSGENEPTGKLIKTICKVRIFSTNEISLFDLSELIECISPGLLFYDKLSNQSSKPADIPRFANHIEELKNYYLNATSELNKKLEPLVLKLYRSLSLTEISNICPVPRRPIPGIPHKKYTMFIPDITDITHEGLLLGTVRTAASNDILGVHLSEKDRLRHFYVLGKTGTGKSSFIGSLLLQDILNCRPSILIDPHGELCDQILESVPNAYLDNIILIDPSISAEYPVCSLNVFDLEYKQGDDLQAKKDYWTNELTSMFLSLYGPEVFGPRIQEYFRAACLTLMDPDIKGTLADVPRLFTDKNYRKDCIALLKDTNALEFWRVFDLIGEREKQEIIPYFTAKFAPMIGSYTMKNFTSQKDSGIKFNDYINENKTVLIKLSKGKIGELGVRLVGMIIMSRLKSLVFARESLPPDQRTNFYLYIDEFQNFVISGFDTLLSESRKYGLGIILAHQYLSQMKQASFQLSSKSDNTPLLDAILGNVGNYAIFRVGYDDAKTLAPHFEGIKSEGDNADQVMPQDLINLDNYEFIARILNNGVQSSPMTISANREEYLNHAVPRSELGERIKYVLKTFKK